MPVVTLFKNRKGRVAVATPKGELIKFANGRYYTQNKEHEKYLKDCADRNACGVYIDKAEPTVDTENATPQDILEKQAIARYKESAEYKALINAAASTNPGNSTVESPQKGVGSSEHTAQAPTTAESLARQTAQQQSAEKTVKVSGDAGAASTAPNAPSKLDELKKGKQ